MKKGVRGRLRRIAGQLEAIERMVGEDRAGVDLGDERERKGRLLELIAVFDWYG